MAVNLRAILRTHGEADRMDPLRRRSECHRNREEGKQGSRGTWGPMFPLVGRREGQRFLSGFVRPKPIRLDAGDVRPFIHSWGTSLHVVAV